VPISAFDEMPEDFLIQAYKVAKSEDFKKMFRDVIKNFLYLKRETSNLENAEENIFISRLIYIVEVLNLGDFLPIIFEFAMNTKYMEKIGANSEDIYSQFLRALAQFQESCDLIGFWRKRFDDDYYINYAQTLFTGIRLSSLEDAGNVLPRLFHIANHSECLDKNLALAPLIDYCNEDQKRMDQVSTGFKKLSEKDQEDVIESAMELDIRLQDPLLDILFSSNIDITTFSSKTINPNI